MFAYRFAWIEITYTMYIVQWIHNYLLKGWLVCKQGLMNYTWHLAFPLSLIFLLRGHSKWLVRRCLLEPHLQVFLLVTTETSSGPVTVVIRWLLPSSSSASTSSSSSPYPWLVSCSCIHCFLSSCSISLFLSFFSVQSFFF